MEMRELGPLGPVSCLALGGGGVGAVWGSTTREEAVATVREAVAGGVTLLDMAPLYGRGEAETVVGEAFGGTIPAGLRVATKCLLGNPPAGEVHGRLSKSLDGSLDRMRLARVDVFILHGQIGPAEPGAVRTNTSPELYREAIIPAFERLRAAGRIGAWGITGVGVPAEIRSALETAPRPAVAQCVANALDALGEMQRFTGPARPRQLIAAAARNGVGVMGIRAVAAGSLTDSLDRELSEGHPGIADFERAAPLRAIARERGVSTALLAHRYALAMPGVATVVLGVKNRRELRDCLAAEAAGPLDAGLTRRIDDALGTAGG